MTASSKVQLELIDVSLRYRGRSGLFKRFDYIALGNVSIQLKQGETLGVLGSNGCGKSSLLRILAGVIDPTSGCVKCDANVSRALLALGAGFRTDLSGRDNALIGAMLQGFEKKDALEMLPAIHKFTELGSFFERPVKTYSAGMRARLGFATALITEVDVLLIDEVLGVGDAHFRDKAQKAIINKINNNQTVVFVSHNPAQVNKICERVVWLDKGEIKMQGDTRAVSKEYQRYVNSLNN
jgi:lipopolysaccharide transport system ATP-binding protein